MKLQNLEISVITEDVLLQEYQVNSESDHKASCYITSEAGKGFKLRVDSSQQDSAFSCHLFVDGTLVDRYLVRARTARRDIDGIHVDNETLRSFIFSSLKTTDSEDAITASCEKQKLEDLGCLRCDFYRIDSYAPEERSGPVPNPIDDAFVVHEKTKKAGTHRVQLGETIYSRNTRSSVVYKDPKGAPYLIFTFKYRPKEMLQAQGIIPLEKTQKPNENGKRPAREEAGPSKRSRVDKDGPNEAGSSVKCEGENGELENLLAERAALDAKIKKAKAREVKREPSPIVLGTAKGEIIDLTSD